MKRKCPIGLMILLAAFPLIAQSKNGLTPVDGLENWKYDLDLGSYAPGSTTSWSRLRTSRGT